ncbi:MAG: 4Fe-4S domain-containing protein [Myxococcota bacterium]
MARPRHPENAPGDWYVDTACIDCGHCRVVAPEVYGDAGDHAIVRAQPTGDTRRAAMALVACPVAAIGTDGEADLKGAVAAFPTEVLPDVFLVGFANERTFGASSWLVRRPGGNVLVDVPRANAGLFRRIRELGGVRWLFLTHRDDVAGHEKIALEFGAVRVISRSVAWYSWSEQVRSIEKLLGVPFAHVLPGHGRPWHGTVERKDEAVRAFLARAP